MTEIICQACIKKPEKEGCSRCGGYRVLISYVEVCPICKRQGWVRPGVWTEYEGKEYQTFDGIDMVCHLDKPNNCADCEHRAS